AGVARPAISPAREEAVRPADRRILQLKQMIAARHAAQTSPSLESAGGGHLAAAVELESSLPLDAPIPPADDLFQRISTVMAAMPPREVGDPVAFRQALEIMFRHGADALGKLPDVGLGRQKTFSSSEHAALEAIVIADGSRPSFLLKDGLP